MSTTTPLLLPTDIGNLVDDLQVPVFDARQLAFFNALLTATQKERLGLRIDPNELYPCIQREASIVGKEELVQWLIESTEALKLAEQTKDPNYNNPFEEVVSPTVELSVKDESNIISSL